MKRLSDIQTDVLAGLIGLFFFLLLVPLALLSKGSYGGADDFIHYSFARYSWELPGLLLDHWAKPFFTLVASPFAQFGYNGIKVMNALFASLSAFLAYRFLRLSPGRGSLMGIVFCMSAPLYFVMACSGMTEIFFGFLLLSASFLFVRKKYVWSVLLVSLIPFVRTEGILCFPVFALALILERKWKVLWWMPAGFVLYSLAGWKYYGDLWWLVHRMPYTGAADIYGHGSLFHFVGQAPVIFGIPLLLFYLAGFVIWICDVRRSKKQVRRILWKEGLLLYGIPLLYFSAHSFVWWKGLAGSLGLSRVMVPLVPLMSVGAGKAFPVLLKKLPAYQPVHFIIPFLCIGISLWQLLGRYELPVPPDPEMRLISEAGSWIKTERLDNNKLYYYHPFLFVAMRANPWDLSRMQEKVPNPLSPGEGLSEGSLVVWDSHFGPNEGRLPLKTLENDPSLILLKSFSPTESFTVLGGGEFQVRVYQKRTEREDSSEGNGAGNSDRPAAFY